MYAPTQVSSRVNYAAIYLPVSRAYDGHYDFYARIPCNSHGNTQNAKYEALPYGTSSGLNVTKTFNQDTACDVSKRMFADTDMRRPVKSNRLRRSLATGKG